MIWALVMVLTISTMQRIVSHRQRFFLDRHLGPLTTQNQRSGMSSTRFYSSRSNDNFEEIDDEIHPHIVELSKPGSLISPYWIEQLKRLPPGPARELISHLTPATPLGFESAAAAARKTTRKQVL